VLLLGGFLAGAAVIFYGFQSDDNHAAMQRSSIPRRTIHKAAIGAVIIFGVYTIIATVQGAAQTVTQ